MPLDWLLFREEDDDLRECNQFRLRGSGPSPKPAFPACTPFWMPANTPASSKSSRGAGRAPCVPSSAVAADLGSAADLLILYCTICWPFLDLWCVRVWLGFDRLRSD